MSRLSEISERIDAEIAGLPAARFTYLERRDFERAITDLRARLGVECDADIRDIDNGVMVKLAGIRAHSTMGLIGALRNWQVAARRRLEERQAS